MTESIAGGALAYEVKRDVLLVEDHELSRSALTRILAQAGFNVTPAVSSRDAIERAASGRFGVVLMDSTRSYEMDGIETAIKIRSVDPRLSILFVSASAHDPDYQRRASERKLRVDGWIDKSISETAELPSLVERETLKSAIRSSALTARRQGMDPVAYLHELVRQDPAVTPRIVEEILAELEAEEDLIPLQEGETVPDMSAIARATDEIYDQIRELIRERIGDPELPELARPLREKLSALQREEARAIELYVRSQILFDPREARKLLDRAEGLLKKDD